jgi:hypothetical protein
MSIVTGWLLPKGSHVEPVEVVVGEGHEAIADLIGCDLIDAVKIGIANDKGEHQVLIGYIDDVGAHTATSIQDINFLASFLFDRNEPLFGDVVVVAGISPTGEYDGENYDLPAWVVHNADEVVDKAADFYNKFLMSMSAVALAADEGLITLEELDEAAGECVEDVDAEKLGELLETSLRYLKIRVEQMENGEELVDFDEGLRRILEEEGGE